MVEQFQYIHEIVYIRCACIKCLQQIIRDKTTVTNHFSMNDDRSARFIWGRTWNVFMSILHLKGTDNQPWFKREYTVE